MNIVHVEDFFHPDAGYQINILPKYMKRDGHNVTVITSKMDKIPESLTSFFGKDDIEQKDLNYEELTGVKIIRVELKTFISGRAVFSNEIFKTVDDLKPDILYVHGNDTLTGIRFLLNNKRLNYPLVMDSHMLEMASVNKFSRYFRLFYKLFITPIIRKNKIPVIRTQDDLYVEKHLGIPIQQCPWISIGSDTILFNKNLNVRKSMRTELCIEDEDFLVLYTGKLDEAKGGKLLAEAFKKPFDTNRRIILIIVGNSVGHYGEEVEKKLANSNNRIIRFPTQKYMDLPKFYQTADLSVFPKQCSLSFYDAQACGLPVVFEDNNINISRIRKKNAFTFKASDVDDFRGKIVECANLNYEAYLKCSESAIDFVRSKYDYSNIYQSYMEVISKEVERYGKDDKKK